MGRPGERELIRPPFSWLEAGCLYCLTAGDVAGYLPGRGLRAEDLGQGLGPPPAATGAVVGGGTLPPLVLGGQRDLPDGDTLLELTNGICETTIHLVRTRHVALSLKQDVHCYGT